MRYTIAALALAAGAQATYNMTGPVYTTEVVTAYTTYCPEATQITHNGETYTITEATTLTITNCPCTVTKPVTSALVTSCYNCAPETSVPVASVPVVYSTPSPVVSTAESVPTASVGIPYPVSNSTAVYVPSGTGSVTSSIPTFTGAANKAFAASGAGLAAVFGFAAYIL